MTQASGTKCAILDPSLSRPLQILMGVQVFKVCHPLAVLVPQLTRHAGPMAQDNGVSTFIRLGEETPRVDTTVFIVRPAPDVMHRVAFHIQQCVREGVRGGVLRQASAARRDPRLTIATGAWWCRADRVQVPRRICAALHLPLHRRAA